MSTPRSTDHPWQPYFPSECARCGLLPAQHTKASPWIAHWMVANKIGQAEALPRVLFEGAGLRVVEKQPDAQDAHDSRVSVVQGRAFRMERETVPDAMGQRGWEATERVSPAAFVEAILGLVEGEQA